MKNPFALVRLLSHSGSHTRAGTREASPMSPAPESSDPAEVESHFRDLLGGAGLDQPDRVEHDPRTDELTFYWDDRQAVLIIEIGENGPVDVRPGAARFRA